MRASLALLSLLVGVSVAACDPYYVNDPYYPADPYYPTGSPPAGVVNIAPYVSGAEAGVYWDSIFGDDVWYFNAYAEDADGPMDVTEVWADVYDAFSGSSEPIQSFALFPGNEPSAWASEWGSASTHLDPYYTGYSIEFVAYDSFGDEGFVSVVPYTY